jgi:PhzF family phenazine biosynthesis protein
MPDIHALKCFGAHAGGGNLALVIENDGGDQAARQAFARERATTCVFVDRAGDGAGAGDIVLDYFYPHARSPLCLHATLAVAHVLLGRATSAENIAVTTAVHGQRLVLSRRGELYFAGLAPQAQTAATPPIPAALPAALLAMPGLALVSAPAVASVGSPKLLLEVADSAVLRSLTPDLAAIAAWGKSNGVNGCYAYCRLADGQYEGRNFNHPDPALEDSATGVAAGALSLHLGRGVRLFQGAALGNPCRIDTEIEDGQILVGGAVETAKD